MAVKLAPLADARPQFFDNQGNVAAGMKVFTYLTGTTTKHNTYTTSSGGVANANPIVLNTAGRPPNGVWLDETVGYTLVLAPANDTDPPTSPIWTEDGIWGINIADAQSTLTEWVDLGYTETRLGATQFSVPGDRTADFDVGRRVKCIDGASTFYGYVSVSSFGAGITTVTVVLDSGALTAALSNVFVSVLNADNSSMPWLKSNSTGLTMTGTLTLAANPASALQATTKQYTDKILSFPTSVRNAGVAVTLGGGAMTIDLKDAAGNDPTAASPVELQYQSATITTGTTANRSVAAALSITIPSTATVGTLSGVPSRIYFGLLDNAGTLELCYWNPIVLTAHPCGVATYSSVGGILRINHSYVYTTVANTTASDLAKVIYSTSVRANVRVTPIGYIDSVQATAGSWATAITRIVLIGPTTPTTGDVINEGTTASGALLTGTTLVPLTDAIPIAGTDGDVYIAAGSGLSFSHHVQNMLEVEAIGNFANSAATDGLVAYIAFGPDLATLAVQAGNVVAAGDQQCIALKSRIVKAGTTSTASLYAGGSAAGTTTFNGRAAGRLYGGAMGSYITVREICT